MPLSKVESQVKAELTESSDITVQSVTVSEDEDDFMSFLVRVQNPCGDTDELSLNDEKRVLQSVSDGFRSIDADLYSIGFEGDLESETLAVAGMYEPDPSV